MNEKEFKRYYIPLIGTEVIDDIFNCPLSSKRKENGLTKVKLQTELIKRFYLEPFQQALLNNNSEALLTLINRMVNNGIELGFNIAKEWLNTNALPYSIGNDKIGNDTLVFNCSTALLCPSDLKGHCEVCKYCYAKNNEIVYGTPFLRNLISLHKLLTVNIDSIIYDTIESIRTNKTKKDGKTAKEAVFIRFNSNGDVLDDNMLIAIDKFAYSLINDNSNNLKVAYTYTHNKDLNLNLSENITFNLSYKSDVKAKKTIVAFKFDKMYLDDSKYVICNGKCLNCPYCKDKDDKRTVVFMVHGGGFKGLEMLPDGLIDVLNDNKARDWSLFNSKLINPSRLTLDDFL